MATIDLSTLTLNAKEVEGFMEFVYEQTFNTPALSVIHGGAWSGVKMKQQVVFASLMGKTGIKDNACARPNSGAKSVLTQKYWEPKNIGDTLVNCQTDIDALFKAYYLKIQKYTDKFNISGSDQEKFLATMVIESAKQAIVRYIWLGDTAVAAADADSAGLKAAGDVKFYDAVNGLWKQIFAEVLAGGLQKVAISENAEATILAQETLAAGRSVAIFEAMWKLADPRLRANAEANFMVSHGIFENYRQYLQDKSQNFSIEQTTEGFTMLKWNGKNIIDMELLWDLNLKADFTANTTDDTYFLPNRAILTVPSNIPYATLNEGDFDSLESWFENKERQNYTAYGFTLDAKWLENYMGVVAY